MKQRNHMQKQKRIWTLPFALLFSLALFTGGCSLPGGLFGGQAGTGGTDGMGNAGSTTVSDADTSSSSESVSEIEIDPRETAEVPDAPGLLDLSYCLDPLVIAAAMEPDTPADPDWDLAAAALIDDDSIFLVYEHDDSEYRCATFELADFSITPTTETFDIYNDGERSEQFNSLQILSVDPLVLYDFSRTVVYWATENISVTNTGGAGGTENTGSANSAGSTDGTIGVNTTNTTSFATGNAVISTFPLDEEHSGNPVVINSEVYLTTWTGFVYHLEEDGSLSVVWTLPEDFAWCYPAYSSPLDMLTLCAAPFAAPETEVYIDLDPATGDYTLYTMEEMRDFYFDACSNDVLCRFELLDETSVYLYDLDRASQKTLSLPASLGLENSYFEGSYCNFAAIPVYEDALLFDETDDRNYLAGLYFWDTASSEVADWTPPAREDYEIIHIDYGELSTRAEELGETYGVKIRIGENPTLTYSTYTAVASTNEWLISTALTTLEATLEKYPPNYFPQLAEGMYREIVLDLVGPMTPVDPAENIESPSAVTFDEDGIIIIALDIDMGLTTGTLCHEFSHVLDYKLTNLGVLDEEAWNAMNPEGFDYYYSYIDEEGNDHQYDADTTWTSVSPEYFAGDYDSVYFYDNYSKTFPTEDRARIIEMLSDSGWIDPCFRGVHMREKANALFAMIRQAFDTTDWPEQTSWEAALENA